jgi:hypothetical protein
MEQNSWDEEDYDEQQDAYWEEDNAAKDEGSSSWDSLAFQQKSTFPSCTTPYCKERNIAHTQLIVVTNCTQQKEMGHQLEGDILFFSRKAKAKERAKVNLTRANVIAKAKISKGKSPKVSEGPLTTPVIFASKRDTSKYNARSTRRCLRKIHTKESGLSCLTKRFMYMIFSRTRWMKAFAVTACAANVTG